MTEVEYLLGEPAILRVLSPAQFLIVLGNNSLVEEASVNVTQPMMVAEEG
jgi:hypothetical protein